MRRLRGDPALQDLLGAIVLVVACGSLGEPDPTRGLWPGGWVLVLVAGASLALRRRLPVPALIASAAATWLYYPLGYPGNPMGLGFLLTLYAVARAGLRAVWIVAVLLFVSGLAVVSTVAENPEAPASLFGIAGVTLVVVALGAAGRARQERFEAVQARAAAAAAEERLRIARDLHDVLAHQISLIAVQSGAALHSGDPDRAQDALRAVNAAGKEALARLRDVLGVMRGVDSWRDAASPEPGLADLERLVDGVRATGLDVRFAPNSATATADVELVAYRIVQEALTNAVRHAHARHVDVDVVAHAGRLRLRVSDDGTGTRGTGPGNGLRGMVERAAAVGGRLTVEDTPSGLTVTADLPLGGTP